AFGIVELVFGFSSADLVGRKTSAQSRNAETRYFGRLRCFMCCLRGMVLPLPGNRRRSTIAGPCSVGGPCRVLGGLPKDDCAQEAACAFRREKATGIDSTRG